MSLTRINAALVNSGIVTKTSGYTAKLTDNLILCSSGAFTVTLPSPSSMTGKILEIMKTDSSLTNIITVSGTGLSTTLNTANESVKVFSDGSNWILLRRAGHFTAPVAFTPTQSNFGTVSDTKVLSWREGRHLIVQGRFIPGTTAAAAAQTTIGFNGSNTPSGLAMDTSLYDSNTRVVGLYGTTQNNGSGHMLYINNATTLSYGQAFASGASQLQTANANGVSPSGGSGGFVAYHFKVAISGWNE